MEQKYMVSEFEIKESEFKERKEIVNEFEITVKEFLNAEETEYKIYYSAIKLDGDEESDDMVHEGYLKSKMSPVEIYHALTSERRFYLDEELLRSYPIFGSVKDSDEFNREILASKLNLPTESITVKIHKNEIYKREVLS